MTVDSSYNGEIIILIYNVKLGITDSGSGYFFRWRIFYTLTSFDHFEDRYVNANDIDKEFHYKQTKK